VSTGRASSTPTTPSATARETGGTPVTLTSADTGGSGMIGREYRVLSPPQHIQKVSGRVVTLKGAGLVHEPALARAALHEARALDREADARIAAAQRRAFPSDLKRVFTMPSRPTHPQQSTAASTAPADRRRSTPTPNSAASS